MDIVKVFAKNLREYRISKRLSQEAFAEMAGLHRTYISAIEEPFHMNKSKTIGELLDEARKKSGAPKLAGHDIVDLERFAPDTRHMIVFDVLTHDSPIGWKGETILNNLYPPLPPFTVPPL